MNINDKRPVPLFHCTYGECFAAIFIIWDSYSAHLISFSDENTRYNANMAVSRKAENQAAKDLPDGQARYAEAESLRIALVKKHDTVIGFWNSLEGYIRKAYRISDTVKPRLEEAGSGHYDKAVNENWNESSLLLLSGKNFINLHAAELTNDGGMPAAFPANYVTNMDTFDANFLTFKAEQQAAQVETDIKLNATNDIYKKTIGMMEDGKHIFRKQPSIKDEFIWDKVISLISPNHPKKDDPIPPVPPVE